MRSHTAVPHRRHQAVGLPQTLLHRWKDWEAKEDEADVGGASLVDKAAPEVDGTIAESASVGGQSLATNDPVNEATKIWLGSEAPSNLATKKMESVRQYGLMRRITEIHGWGIFTLVLTIANCCCWKSEYRPSCHFENNKRKSSHRSPVSFV